MRIGKKVRFGEPSRQCALEYQQILNVLPAAAYTCDAEGLITFFNRRAVQLWGRQPRLNDPVDRFCGSWRLFSVDGTPIPHDECWLALALRERREYHECEFVIEQPDGGRRLVLAHASPLYDGDRLTGAVNVLIDVTDQKRMEATLREEEARKSAIVQSALDAVITMDDSGHIVDFNPAASKMFGYHVSEIVGRPLAETIIPERLREQHTVAFRRYLRTGVGAILDQRIEMPALRRDGSEFPVELTVTATQVGERPPFFTAYLRDLTIQKKAIEARRETEERFASFMQHLPAAAWIKDTQGQYAYINAFASQLFGIPSLQLQGRTDSDVFPATTAHAFRESDRQVCENGQVLQKLETFEREGGDEREFVVTKFPIFGATGEVSFVGGVAFDVTRQRQAVHAQKASESKLRALLDNTRACVFAKDTSGRYIIANKSVVLLFGWPDAQYGLGKTDYELHPRELADAFVANDRKVLSGGKPLEFEEVIQDQEGTRTYLVLKFPLRDVEDRIYAVCGIASDISDRKRAEEALRQSEERYRAVVESQVEMLCRFKPEGTILFVNGAYAAARGTTPDDLIGRSFWEFVAEKDRAVVEALLKQLTPESPEVRIENRFETRDGERWTLWLNRALEFDSAGRLLEAQSSGIDITERKRAEGNTRFLADASAALAEVVDYENTLKKIGSIAVPTFADWSAVDLLTDDGGIRRVTVQHSDPDKVLLAQELLQRYPPRFADPHGVGHVARSGEPELVEEIPDALLAAVARDDQHLRVLQGLGLRSYVCVPMILRGRTLGVITFVMAESGRRFDATDLTVAQDLADRASIAIENATLYRALQDADRRKDEFLATLAHELRNPLAPIHTGLELMKMVADQPATIEEIRATMARQTEQLITLVDDLLDVCRITQGKLELRKAQVKLSDIVQSAVEAVQSIINEARHELSISLKTPSIQLQADQHRLAQVLSNLLNNAAKYTPERGHIWLTADSDGTDVVLSVKDNGVGIPPEMLGHIFEMFAQVEGTGGHFRTGLGIGLTLVKSLVEMHDGTIEVHSDGLHHGSEFVVRIPVGASSPDQSSQESRLSQPAVTAKRYRVLVVDDNQAAATMLARVVALLGHEVRTANDGRQAVDVTADFRPHLVLMDIGMPNMNGYEAAQCIRQQPWGKAITLVALTGWGQDEDKQRTKAAGFDRHLVKPAETTDLRELFVELERQSEKAQRTMRSSDATASQDGPEDFPRE